MGDVSKKIVRVTPASAAVPIGTGEMGRAELIESVLLFVFNETKAAGYALHIPVSRLNSLEAKLKELSARVEKDFPGTKFSVKVVAPYSAIPRIKEACQSVKLDVVAAAESRFRLSQASLDPESGKIRLWEMVLGKKRKKVLIVDDSPTILKLLRKLIEAEPDLELVGESGKPLEVEKMVESLRPDVITLDIHMPDMDGITLLKQLRKKFSTPVIMISSVSFEDGTKVLKAMEAGAVDFIQKPTIENLPTVSQEIIEKLKIAAESKSRSSHESVALKNRLAALALNTNIPVVIGSSTGGTEALREVLGTLPKNIPPILIVQHIPPVFSKAFAMRLNEHCQFKVKEAEDGEKVVAGTVYIAPGGFHMTVKGSLTSAFISVSDKPEGYRHKPAVDVLFDSAANTFGKECIAVIMTGMGKDGADGMLKLRKLGVRTIGQDEASCVVYGMPRAAAEVGAVEVVASLEKIPEVICQMLTSKKKAA